MKEIPVKDLMPLRSDVDVQAIAKEIAIGVVDIDVRRADGGYEVVNGSMRLQVRLDQNENAQVRDVESREIFKVARDDNGLIVRI